MSLSLSKAEIEAALAAIEGVRNTRKQEEREREKREGRERKVEEAQNEQERVAREEREVGAEAEEWSRQDVSLTIPPLSIESTASLLSAKSKGKRKALSQDVEPEAS
jgi:hypothetical protein